MGEPGGRVEGVQVIGGMTEGTRLRLHFFDDQIKMEV